MHADQHDNTSATISASANASSTAAAARPELIVRDGNTWSLRDMWPDRAAERHHAASGSAAQPPFAGNATFHDCACLGFAKEIEIGTRTQVCCSERGGSRRSRPPGLPSGWTIASLATRWANKRVVFIGDSLTAQTVVALALVAEVEGVPQNHTFYKSPKIKPNATANKKTKATATATATAPDYMYPFDIFRHGKGEIRFQNVPATIIHPYEFMGISPIPPSNTEVHWMLDRGI